MHSPALLIVTEEIAQPLSKEFRQIYDEQNYGKPLPDVLKGFTERVPLLDVRIFVTAVMTQREEATSRKCSTTLGRHSRAFQGQTSSPGCQRTRSHYRLGARCPSAGSRAVLYSIAPDHVMLLVRDPIGLHYRGGHHPPDHRNPRDPAHREGRVLDRGERRCLQS